MHRDPEPPRLFIGDLVHRAEVRFQWRNIHIHMTVFSDVDNPKKPRRIHVSGDYNIVSDLGLIVDDAVSLINLMLAHGIAPHSMMRDLHDRHVISHIVSHLGEVERMWIRLHQQKIEQTIIADVAPKVVQRRGVIEAPGPLYIEQEEVERRVSRDLFNPLKDDHPSPPDDPLAEGFDPPDDQLAEGFDETDGHHSIDARAGFES